MKKLLLSAVAIVAMATTVLAQDAETMAIEKPDATKKATIDAYVDNAFSLRDQKAELAKTLEALEAETKEASLTETDEARAMELKKKADDLEAAYLQLGLDIEENAKKAEPATKQTADCGIKAPKCMKAVKTATKVMTNLTKGLKDEVKRATNVKSKVEALEETAE